MNKTAVTRDQLVEWIKQYQKVAVAFSGGVDSAVVAAASFEALVDNAIAVISVSPALPQQSYQDARGVAEQIGIRLVELSTDEFKSDQYRENTGRRCFHCKDTLYQTIFNHRDQIEYDVILNGANHDDLSDYRPGMEAADKHQVLSPLIELGIGKAEVRQLAESWNLSVWDKPASPCLSSRIAYGVEVTPDRVRKVDQAEEFLRELLCLKELRVRVEANDLARIELPLESVALASEHENRKLIVEQLQQFGFKTICVDLAGFRSGSMNARLETELVQITRTT